jgi:hypothetical protein
MVKKSKAVRRPSLRTAMDRATPKLPALETLRTAEQFRTAASVLMQRWTWLRQAGITFNGERDLYHVLGYKRVLGNRDYRERYERGGLAGAVVDRIVDACWRGSMELREDKDEKTDKPFEAAWKALDARLQVQSKFARVDRLSRLSEYAVLLIGAPGDSLAEELPRGTDQAQIIYLEPFSGGGGPSLVDDRRADGSDADARVRTYETDARNKRFGRPLTYGLRRVDVAAPMLQTEVHWSRIIHLAEGLLEDDVYGQPALRRVWNLFDDLEKVTGGGAEAFWLRANAGLHLDVDKDMQLADPDPSTGKSELEKLKEQAESYAHQMTRMMRTRGVKIEQLGSDVANFANPADAIITQIAGSKGLPKRVLVGSEAGELASSQDRDNWKDQVNGRQTIHLAPNLVRNLAGRLIAYGYLPTPVGGVDKYDVVWPHIQTLTETEKAEGAAKWAQVNQMMGVTVFTDADIRDKWYGMAPTDESVAESWRATLALRMAEANKAQGVTLFTDDEIRMTCYGWKPLTPEEKVPIGAPERISVNTPPPLEGATPPVVPALPAKLAPAKLAPALKAAQSAEMAETLRALEAAIEAEDGDAIVRILADVHKFSTTQVQIPESFLAYGAQLPDADLDAQGREMDPHVTLKYGLHTDDAEVVRNLIAGRGPITYTFGKTNYFTAGGYDVLYVEVFSEDLKRLNKIISEGTPVTDTHEYTPHATVAYLKPGRAAAYAGDTSFLGQQHVASSVTFCSADGERTVLSVG